MSACKVPSHFSWLSRYARGFPVRGEQVLVLKSPQEFYQTILEQVKKAKKRILISSLYLGTGELEEKLVHTIESSLSDNSNLNCTILLDHLRGTRGSVNSVTMLDDTLKHTHQLKLHLYHTPLLRGIIKWLLPQRFNEVIGLQHTKILLFDDNLLLTGANLSVDYFTTRHDRYILFKGTTQLSNFVSSLFEIICDHSFLVSNNVNTAEDRITSPVLNPLTNHVEHQQSMEECINRLIMAHSDTTTETDSSTNETDSKFTNADFNGTSPHFNDGIAGFNSKTDAKTSPSSHSSSDNDSDADTMIYPLIQMGPYDIRQDEQVTERLLASPDEQDRAYLASGYFNLPPLYSSAIMKSRGVWSVLAASPQANGFYGARGVAKYVPYMYVHFAKCFLQLIVDCGQDDHIKYSEYKEDGWTFHSKGVWYYVKDHEYPCLSLIGSSNYGFRSLARDIEFQVAIVTDNKELQTSLHNERASLFSKGEELSLAEVTNDPTRQLSPLVLLATKLFQKFV